ncbi:MAG: BACON domain-containing protein [Synergistaceae bacterium]|nr:BACON domain-containing protein [Synergistaceae bacterium]
MIKPSWKWESKEEYKVSDYNRANISGGKRAGWRWEFNRPADGGHSIYGVWLHDVSQAGRTSVNLKSEFVFQVSKEDWKKYPSLKLVNFFKSAEGASEGGGTTMFAIGNTGRRNYSYDWQKYQADYTLPRPPHIAVTQAKFNFKPTAAKGESQTVLLQSEENWTASANASWIHLTTSENNTKTENGNETVSGNATGSSQKQVLISVDPVTDGKDRGGKVIFKASDGETCVVELLQAGK